MLISVIIPVFNNAQTLPRVLAVVTAHPRVREVIAVDDASADDSWQILQSYPRIRSVRHRRNLGKGAGIARGWQEASSAHLLTADADLALLTKTHIDNLLDEYDKGWDMVIAARNRTLLWGRLSGERVYRKSVVMPYAPQAQIAGNGIEQIVNFAHRRMRVKTIVARNIGHVLKYERHPPHRAAWYYMKEGWQLVSTESRLRLQQLYAMIEEY